MFILYYDGLECNTSYYFFGLCFVITEVDDNVDSKMLKTFDRLLVKVRGLVWLFMISIRCYWIQLLDTLVCWRRHVDITLLVWEFGMEYTGSSKSVSNTNFKNCFCFDFIFSQKIILTTISSPIFLENFRILKDAIALYDCIRWYEVGT